MEDQVFREHTSHDHSIPEDSNNKSIQSSVKADSPLDDMETNKASPVIDSQTSMQEIDETMSQNESNVGRCDI